MMDIFERGKTYRFEIELARAAGLTPLGEKNLARFDGMVFQPHNTSLDGSHADADKFWGIDRAWCEPQEE